MSLRNRLRRPLLVGAAALTAIGIGAAPAMAHDCFIPMYSLNAPKSANWEVTTAEAGVARFMGLGTCPARAAAGYAALRDAGLPLAIKVSMKMTIGDPKGTGRTNPNGANGKGLEYFSAGSTLPDDMLATYYAAAVEVDCGT